MNREIGGSSQRRRAWQLLGSGALGFAGLMLVLTTFIIIMHDNQETLRQVGQSRSNTVLVFDRQ